MLNELNVKSTGKNISGSFQALFPAGTMAAEFHHC